MKQYISSFKTAFVAEHIKKKGTSIYLLSVMIGALSPIILFISRLNGSTRHMPRVTHNAYSNFLEVSLELFCFYFLPLLIIILTSRIAQLDHKNNGWQLMETLPVKKFGNFFSKFSIVIIANSIAVFTYAITSILFVYLLSLTGDLSNLATVDLPSSIILNIVLRLIVAALFLSALQFVFSVIFSNFLIPIFIGIIGFSLNTYLNETGTLWSWYPYASISNIFRFPNGSDLGYSLTYIDVLSFIGCLIIVYIGYYWFKTKSLKSVFIGSKKQIAQTVIVIISLVAMFIYIQKPKQLDAHNSTVLQGEIDSYKKFNTLSIVEPFTNDTIANIPIVDNKFDYKFDHNVSLNRYNIFLDNDHRSKLIFGTNDSIYINFNIYKDIKAANITGTRLAENKIGIRNEESFIPYYMEDEMMLINSTQFFNKMKAEWRSRVKAIKKFKTVDNYTFRDDFEKRNNILLQAEYHYFLEEYKKKVALLYPDRKIKIPADIKLFENPIPYNETLLNNDFYLYSVVNQLIKDNNQDTDKDTKVLKAISALETSKFKDMLMYWQLDKSIQEVSNNKDIDVLVSTYLDEIKDTNLRNRISANAILKRSLDKGSSAPFFKSETVEGHMITVNDLKGKYTVIDVWATWCAPCAKDAPYFEKFALKYTNENIQFVSISTDIDKHRDNWKLRTKELSQTILQLRSIDDKAFMNAYNIPSLPRYMVLDPEGNILNIDLPRPSTPNFEPLLKSVMSLK